MSGSGISWAICKSASRPRQITTPAPHRSVFYRPDALPAAQPTASKHWRHNSKISTSTKIQIDVPIVYWLLLIIFVLICISAWYLMYIPVNFNFVWLGYWHTALSINLWQHFGISVEICMLFLYCFELFKCSILVCMCLGQSCIFLL